MDWSEVNDFWRSSYLNNSEYFENLTKNTQGVQMNIKNDQKVV